MASDIKKKKIDPILRKEKKSSNPTPNCLNSETSVHIGYLIDFPVAGSVDLTRFNAL